MMKGKCMMQPEMDNISPTNNLVSVVIPCYNQGRFLGEAIESVLSQSYKHVEIIVIDDGSTDTTCEVAKAYPMVRYFYQQNQGLAWARNAGLHHSTGSYIIFLDSDDLLLSNAVSINLAYLLDHPEYAFVAGNYQYINTDGSVITPTKYRGVKKDFYLGLLRVNYIGMPGIVMYRREIVKAIGGFNAYPGHPGCEDYDIYLRIARRFPVFCHEQVIASYRRHGNGLSNKPAMMLQSALYVLEQQWPYVRTREPAMKNAYWLGRNTWRNLYGLDLLHLVLRNVREGNLRDGYRNFQFLWPHILPAIVWQARRAFTRSVKSLWHKKGYTEDHLSQQSLL